MSAAPVPPEPPRIHEATLASGASGAAIKGAEIDVAAAVARRQAGQDIVVCGDDLKANRRLARAIESAVGRASKPHSPHDKAGPLTLPHFISNRASQTATRSTKPTSVRPGGRHELLYP